jgi:hypothetical protein
LFHFEYSGLQKKLNTQVFNFAPKLYHNFGARVKLFLITYFLCVIKKQLGFEDFSCIIGAMMKYKYTVKQFAEFRKFCLRHNLKFATMAEYQSALAQYFKD